MLLDSETKVTHVRETSLFKFVFLDSKSSFQKVSSFVTSNSNVAGYLFSSSYGERSNSNLGHSSNWLLSTEISKNFNSFGQFVSTFTDATVDDQFVNLDFSHWILKFILLSTNHRL